MQIIPQPVVWSSQVPRLFTEFVLRLAANQITLYGLAFLAGGRIFSDVALSGFGPFGTPASLSAEGDHADATEPLTREVFSYVR